MESSGTGLSVTGAGTGVMGVLSSTAAGNSDVLQVTKNPSGSHSGNGVSISMGASSTGRGVSIVMATGASGNAIAIQGNTVTTNAPVFTATQNWNAGGVSFQGILLNVTNTASAAASTLLDLQVGGTSKFQVGVESATFAMQYVSAQATTTVTLDWNAANCQTITLANNGQTFTFSNPIAGGRYLLRLQQPASGAAGTVTWPANVKWPGGSAPTLTATNGQVDIVTFYYDGTDYLGATSLNYTP
jgi:hypothetical protein